MTEHDDEIALINKKFPPEQVKAARLKMLRSLVTGSRTTTELFVPLEDHSIHLQPDRMDKFPRRVLQEALLSLTDEGLVEGSDSLRGNRYRIPHECKAAVRALLAKSMTGPLNKVQTALGHIFDKDDPRILDIMQFIRDKTAEIT